MNMIYDENLDKALQGSGQDWNVPSALFSNDPKGKRMLNYLGKDCLSVLLLSGGIWFYSPDKLGPNELLFRVEENVFIPGPGL